MVSRTGRGFSLLELMIVLSIFLIASVMAMMSIGPALRDARCNNAYATALTQLRRSRQTAIDQRKRYIAVFNAPQTIQIFRQDGGTPLPARVLVSTIQLPTDIQFRAEPGIPNIVTQSPDNLGTGARAIDLDQGVAGGLQNEVHFFPDGTARDVNQNINNGVVYLARPGELYSSRAVSLFGATGRIKGWRLVPNGGPGTPRWIQQ
jgi:prepilin-type N-terminal cleavage/methylation domain-containing protein